MDRATSLSIVVFLGLATARGVCGAITSPTQTLTPSVTPTGAGIAARYPNDKNIESDPAVIMADDFEGYASASELPGTKWSQAAVKNNLSISSNAFAGAKSLQMTLYPSTTEVGPGVIKNLATPQEVLFCRAYMKWDPGYNVPTSNHNGIFMGGGQGTAGNPCHGYDCFVMLSQNNAIRGETPPGYLEVYAYWPKQRTDYGDHWYPTGQVIPWVSGIGTQGDWLAYPSQYPHFKAMPDFLPVRDKWYCYEQMVKLNTPGQNNGEVKLWVDGNLVADFTDLVIRTVDTLKIDQVYINLHALHSERTNIKWYDNVVIATSYIGPMASASPSPTPTPTPTQTPTVSPSPTASPTPTPTPVTNQTLANISTRGVVQTGNGVLIGGFILKGNASNEVLMRGLGPSLRASGVANVLSNPLIELHDSTGALIGRNDGWKRDFNHNAIPVTLEPSNDSESALDRTLSPGSYTIILKGAQGQTGVGLFELYDISGEGSTVENISTRGVVQAGDDVLIGGFILRGHVGNNQRVILRAIGPSLARFGVTGCLANPSLRIFNSDGVMIGQNDNWGDSHAAEITQTLLAPLDPLESAIILNLPPGNYTAVVSGVGGDTGNALVEVYLLP